MWCHSSRYNKKEALYMLAMRDEQLSSGRDSAKTERDQAKKTQIANTSGGRKKERKSPWGEKTAETR
jgi:hypothetical protein